MWAINIALKNVGFPSYFSIRFIPSYAFFLPPLIEDAWRERGSGKLVAQYLLSLDRYYKERQ